MRRCPACLAEVEGAARFCGRCGHGLSGPADQVHDRAWHAFRPVLRLWVLLLATNLALLLWTHASDSTSPAGDAVATVVFALIVVLFAWPSRDALAPRLARSGLDATTWWHVPALLAAMFVFMASWFALLAWVGVPFLAYIDSYLEHDWPLWSAFLFIAVFPGLFEELAFRGFIQGRLAELLGERDAWILQAALFAVIHLSPVIFVSHFLMGLGFGWLRNRSGSLWPGILAHGLWNAWVITAESRGWSWAWGLG